MKVVYTAAAENDLRAIGEWLAAHYPFIAPQVERRIRDVVAHIASFPASGPRAGGRDRVRVVPLAHYPYKIFYRATADTLEILHIRHSARRPWRVRE